MRYSKNREEAEDILQEGFMKVFENLSSFRNEGSLEGWIRRIMFHIAIQKYRQGKKEENTVSIDNTYINLNGRDYDETLSHLGTKELMTIIQKLSPKYRMVFNLYVFEGMKHREIAEQLGISEGTSKSNLSDARAILQKAIQQNSKVAQPTPGNNGK